MLIEEKEAFKVLYFNNLTDHVDNFQTELTNNYIQLFFCTEKEVKIAFNMLKAILTSFSVQKNNCM